MAGGDRSSGGGDRRSKGGRSGSAARGSGSRSGSSKGSQSRSGQSRSGQSRSGQSRSGQSRSGQSRSGQSRSGRTESGGAKIGDETRNRQRGMVAVHPGADLPKWLRDEVGRSTPKDRREGALAEIHKGLKALSDDRPGPAQVAFRKAKSLSPRAASVREFLGVASYQVEDWEEALRELRTFRRLTGQPNQMPVEMDCLRALGRDGDTAKLWDTFTDLEVDREIDDEMRVVYASALLDRGELGRAWRVIQPGRLVASPQPSRVRRWAVAARIAHASGDLEVTEKIVDAIRSSGQEPEWLPELEEQLEI